MQKETLEKLVSQSSSFYTHQTDLYSDINPHFSVKSTTLPLELRNPTVNDASALLRHFTDQRNVQHDSSVAGLDTPPAIETLIKQWNTFTDPLDRVNAVAVIDGKTVGSGGIGWIGSKPDGTRVGDAGIMLDTEVRGKGYAYEALRITIDYGLRVLGLDEVHLATRDVNIPMRGLMDKKLGFEGKRIQDTRFGNDWLWEIGKEQWLACQHSK